VKQSKRGKLPTLTGDSGSEWLSTYKTTTHLAASSSGIPFLPLIPYTRLFRRHQKKTLQPKRWWSDAFPFSCISIRPSPLVRERNIPLLSSSHMFRSQRDRHVGIYILTGFILSSILNIVTVDSEQTYKLNFSWMDQPHSFASSLDLSGAERSISVLLPTSLLPLSSMYASTISFAGITLLSLANAAPANLVKRASGKVRHLHCHLGAYSHPVQAGISWPIQELSAAPIEQFFGPGSVGHPGLGVLIHHLRGNLGSQVVVGLEQELRPRCLQGGLRQSSREDQRRVHPNGVSFHFLVECTRG